MVKICMLYLENACREVGKNEDNFVFIDEEMSDDEIDSEDDF